MLIIIAGFLHALVYCAPTSDRYHRSPYVHDESAEEAAHDLQELVSKGFKKVTLPIGVTYRGIQ